MVAREGAAIMGDERPLTAAAVAAEITRVEDAKTRRRLERALASGLLFERVLVPNPSGSLNRKARRALRKAKR